MSSFSLWSIQSRCCHCYILNKLGAMKSFFKAMNKNVEMDLSVWNSNFQGLMRPNKKIGPQIREIMNDSMCNEILSDGERVFEAVTTKFTWKFQGKKIMD
jgi:hypothetical protein